MSLDPQTPPSPYRDRRTWLISVRELADWKVKVYGISASGEDLPEAVLESALAHAADQIPGGIESTSREGMSCGFIVLHTGTEAAWLLVDLWFEDILHHFLFRAALEDPTRWTSPPNDTTAAGDTAAGGVMACAWELEVIQHERDAWVRHVLSRPEEPDFDAYLNDHLAIVV